MTPEETPALGLTDEAELQRLKGICALLDEIAEIEALVAATRAQPFVPGRLLRLRTLKRRIENAKLLAAEVAHCEHGRG